MTMQVIYEPRGRAREYADLAANIYSGCGHGCKYCYAPAIAKRERLEYESARSRPRIIENLRADCIKMAEDKRQVLFSFLSDMYQPLNDLYRLSTKALRLIKDHDMRFCVLTKGGTRALIDKEFYTPDDAYAITLTTMDYYRASEWEPGASTPRNRIIGLKEMKSTGCQTWISLEPVIWPEESLKIIDETHELADKYKVGKINHDSLLEDKIDWHRFAHEAIERLEEYGKPYYIKKDLARYL